MSVYSYVNPYMYYKIPCWGCCTGQWFIVASPFQAGVLYLLAFGTFIIKESLDGRLTCLEFALLFACYAQFFRLRSSFCNDRACARKGWPNLHRNTLWGKKITLHVDIQWLFIQGLIGATGCSSCACLPSDKRVMIRFTKPDRDLIERLTALPRELPCCIAELWASSLSSSSTVIVSSSTVH